MHIGLWLGKTSETQGEGQPLYTSKPGGRQLSEFSVRVEPFKAAA
jgi:hypothetical protein